MVNFDIEAAKKGAKVVTRDGRKARILCFDLQNKKPIVAIITGKDGTEFPVTYFTDGTLVKRKSLKNKGHENEIFTEERTEDLMMKE